MILWRLIEDVGTLLEGSCISDSQYRNVYFVDKAIFEPLSEEDQKELIEVDERNYCEANGLKRILFYTPEEVTKFMIKLRNAAYRN